MDPDDDFAFSIEPFVKRHEAEEGEQLRRVTHRKVRTVCKHWLRGMCKAGPLRCRWLHEYNPALFPFCQFLAEHGKCLRDECQFRHYDLDVVPHCVKYEQGFCSKGPRCRFLHVRRKACRDHLLFGWCAGGCGLAHPPPPYARVAQPDVTLVSRSSLPSAPPVVGLKPFGARLPRVARRR